MSAGFFQPDENRKTSKTHTFGRVVVGDMACRNGHHCRRPVHRNLVIGLRRKWVLLVGSFGVEIVETTPLFYGFAMIVEVDDRILITVNKHHSRILTLISLSSIIWNDACASLKIRG